VVTVVFQTGKIPDLMAGKRAGKSAVRKKIAAKYQQLSKCRGTLRSSCCFLVFNLLSLAVWWWTVAAGSTGGGISGAVVHHSPLRFYT
jgi:hypothetical protein